MPIDHKLKFIFVHIPKTGGWSVENYFEVCKKENLWSHNRVMINEILFAPQHITASMLREHKEVKNYFKDYFKFSFVRNPYDKILSEFFWRNKIKLIKPQNYSREYFSTWLNEVYMQREDHYISQYSYLFGSGETCLVDYVAKFENFENELNYIKDRLGFKINKKIPVINKNEIAFDKNYYLTVNNKLKISELYKRDFEVFGYSK